MYYYSGLEYLKKSRPKNSWNEINQFHGIFFFWFFPFSESDVMGKNPKRKFREIDLLDFTSFFCLDFWNFLNGETWQLNFGILEVLCKSDSNSYIGCQIQIQCNFLIFYRLENSVDFSTYFAYKAHTELMIND